MKMIYNTKILIAITIGIMTALKFFKEAKAVRIINLKVPPTYTLENRNKPDPLILDCEYEIGPEEKGFVLKWLLDNISIYQWIPNKKGFPMGFMKNKIDATYLPSENSYRAISIFKPEWNMTGEYTCSVQTFESTEKKSSHLQIIIPEIEFALSAKSRETHIEITCTVREVFPKPSLKIMLDDRELLILTDLSREDNGLYTSIVKAKVPRDQTESPMPIICILQLPGTNYTKIRETLFYDQGFILTTTVPSQEEEIPSEISRLEAEETSVVGKGSSFLKRHHYLLSETSLLAYLLILLTIANS